MGKKAKLKAAAKPLRHPDATTPKTMEATYRFSPRNFRRLRARTAAAQSAMAARSVTVTGE